MIVLVSFIFAKSSEWRNFTTELNLAGFLSSRASLLNIYIFTVDENRKGPGLSLLGLLFILEYDREYDFMTMKIAVNVR